MYVENEGEWKKKKLKCSYKQEVAASWAKGGFLGPCSDSVMEEGLFYVEGLLWTNNRAG